MKQSVNSRAIGAFFLVATATGWGLGWSAMKLLMRDWPPLFSRGVGGMAASLILAIIAVRSGERHAKPQRHRLRRCNTGRRSTARRRSRTRPGILPLRMLAAKNSRKRIEARAPAAAATGRAGELIGMSWFMMDGSRQAARDNPLRPMHSTGDIHCGL